MSTPSKVPRRLFDLTEEDLRQLFREERAAADRETARAVELVAERTAARVLQGQQPKSLTSKEAAALVGRSPGAFKQFLLRNTDFPRGKAGKRLIFDEARIRAWMEANPNPKRKRSAG